MNIPNMDIKDEVLEWNNRSFTVEFYKGRCRLTDQPSDCSVRMSIGTLTALLLGYKTGAQLYRRERIQASQEAATCLDDVIFHHAPYISDYI